MAVLFTCSAVLYVVLDDYVMPEYTRHGSSVSLPNVEGVSFETAREQLEGKGLDVERQEGRYNPNVSRGEVVDQTPDPGRAVKPGRRVYLTVNSGTARRVQVPDVLTLSVRSARNRLRTVGLRVDSVRVDTIPAANVGTVTRQEPAPGDTLDEGDGVVLWSAQGVGETRASIPNVYGLSVSEARERLLAARLRATVLDTTRADTSSASSLSPQMRDRKRFVMGQRPLPGERMLAGRDVKLYVTTDSIQASRARPPADSLRPGPERSDAFR